MSALAGSQIWLQSALVFWPSSSSDGGGNAPEAVWGEDKEEKWLLHFSSSVVAVYELWARQKFSLTHTHQSSLIHLAHSVVELIRGQIKCYLLYDSMCGNGWGLFIPGPFDDTKRTAANLPVTFAAVITEDRPCVAVSTDCLLTYSGCSWEE